MLVKLKENEENINEAAKILQEVQVLEFFIFLKNVFHEKIYSSTKQKYLI